MASTRSFSSVATAPTPSTAPGRHRLRAVDRDEDWGLPRSNAVESSGNDVADFLPPGATWLPAPQHALPVLPGQPPMIGYLVLVPADQQPLFPLAVTDRAEPPAATGGGADRAADPLVRIDTVQRTAEVDGRVLDLTYLEFELLAHLVRHPHRVHTRDQLVSTVWGYGHVGDGRTVDVHVARLRRKLGTQHRQAIQTVRRVGYKYTPPTGR
ncbi:winged helix-turn-helix domain-containing protein [Streptomyces rhizosphaerihabitans]|uniref:winged helix-turn-helix domain-containing protein n=1 Tax=Streptomyces rhizosphaerihabitans TaxID=1266770 RepID=UPI0021BFB800|nr:winged helix-turn-helix domain-containing protein [Streptomyces rhizosphaerihabitans]MCT9010169.1 winged helix-turn-helix domain-containing protein [Streptomyces rhizosphaerihabitans]